jgi:predicted porin
MRLKMMACVLAATPALSYAQSSLTLYGIVDTGVQYLNHSSFTTGGTQVGMINAGYWPSLFGMTGSEDLGGGNSVIFKLENGFDSTSGASIPSDVLFNRAALVGFKSAYGTVTMGRQYSVQYDKTLSYDPTYMASYSILSLTPVPLATLRLSDSVKYQSANMGGFNFEAMYSFGQQLAGNAVAGRYIGTGAEYVHGPFAMSATYEQTRGSVLSGVDYSSLVDQRYTVAMKYSVPLHYIVSAGATRIGGDLELSPRGTVYWATGGVWLSPAVDINLIMGRYDYQRTGLHSTLLTTSVSYWLSRQTFLYANVGYMGNQGAADLSIYSYNITQPGKNQLGASMGIDKEF